MHETPRRRRIKISRRAKRSAFFTIVVLLVLFLAIQAVLFTMVNPVLENVIRNSIRRASNEHYSVEFGRLRTNIFTRTITIRDLHLKPDSVRFAWYKKNGQYTPDIYQIYIPEVRLSALEIWKAWRNKDLEAGSLFITRPEITITREIQDSGVQKPAKNPFEITRLIPKNYHSLGVHLLKLEDGRLDVVNGKEGLDKPFAIRHISFRLDDFHIDSASVLKDDRLFYADSFRMYLADYALALPDSLHMLYVSNIEMGKGDLALRKIHIAPDSLKLKKLSETGKPAPSTMIIDIPEIDLKSLDIARQWKERALHIDSIGISYADITLDLKRRRAHPLDSISNIYKMVSHYYDTLTIGNINLADARLKLKGRAIKRDRNLILPHVSIRLDKVKVDSASAYSPDNLFYCQDARVNVKGYAFISDNRMYEVRFGDITASTGRKNFMIRDISLIPRFGQYEFARIRGSQVDRVEMKAGSVILTGINFSRFLENQELDASTMTMHGLRVDIFRDMRIPPPPGRRPPMPAQILRETDDQVYIGSVKIENAHFSYEEHGAGSAKPGKINFENVTGTIKNVTNYPAYISKNISMTVSGHGIVMGNIPMTVEMKFPLGDRMNRFSISGRSEAGDLSKMNAILGPGMGVNIQQGHLQRLEYSATGDGYSATGSMTMLYNGLSVESVNKRTGQTEGLKQRIISFIANVIIEPANPEPGKPVRTGNFTVQRDERKSFFNYWANMIMSGMTSSIGASEEIQKAKERKEKRKERRTKRTGEKAGIGIE